MHESKIYETGDLSTSEKNVKEKWRAINYDKNFLISMRNMITSRLIVIENNYKPLNQGIITN